MMVKVSMEASCQQKQCHEVVKVRTYVAIDIRERWRAVRTRYQPWR